MNLKTNILWSLLSRFLVRGLTIIKTIILARILLPTQFGVFGIAALFLGVLEMFTETGVNVVLIQQKKKIDYYLNTGWVVSIARGVLIFVFIIVLANPVARYFNVLESIGVIYVIAAVAFIRGFINPAIVAYQKDLKFKQEFIFRSSVTLAEVVFSIIFAIYFKSEIGLVLGMLVAAIVEVVLSFVVISKHPKFVFEGYKLKSLIKQGRWVTLAKIFDYLFAHIDDIFVGKILGTYNLGLYQQAYRITSFPITEAAESLQRVTFPAYSLILGDRELIKKTYLKTLFYTLVLVVPFCVLLLIFPNQIVGLVLGENWIDSVPVVQILVFFSLFKTIGNSAYPLLLAYKKQYEVMKITLVGLLIIVPLLILLTSSYGIGGVAFSVSMASLLMLISSMYYLLRSIK